jgi:hypothetical protein
MSPRKKHAPKDYSADQTKGSIICNLEKYAYLTVSPLSSSASNRSAQPRPQGGKIDASSSSRKEHPDRARFYKSGQKSHRAMFSWREVIEWRKLASRTCALEAINIAEFNRRQPFSVCASLEVESVSYSHRREGVPRSAAPRMGRANRQLIGGLGNNSCSGRRAKSQSCLLLLERFHVACGSAF